MKELELTLEERDLILQRRQAQHDKNVRRAALLDAMGIVYALAGHSQYSRVSEVQGMDAPQALKYAADQLRELRGEP